MNTGIFFSLEKIARPLFCMVNKKLERNKLIGPENRGQLGVYIKRTDYTQFVFDY